MQLRRLLTAMMVAIGAWVWPFGYAQASTVLYDDVGFIQGEQSFTQSFDITSAGTLTVSLSQVSWLDTINDLNFFMSTAGGVIGKTLSPGTETMHVGPGMTYVHWFGDANGAYDLGVYGMKVTFQPGAQPVALPGSLILLLSGLGVLLGWQRKQMPPPIPNDDEALTI